jgi:hypothetical protein
VHRQHRPVAAALVREHPSLIAELEIPSTVSISNLAAGDSAAVAAAMPSDSKAKIVRLLEREHPYGATFWHFGILTREEPVERRLHAA